VAGNKRCQIYSATIGDLPAFLLWWWISDRRACSGGISLVARLSAATVVRLETPGEQWRCAVAVIEVHSPQQAMAEVTLYKSFRPRCVSFVL
jgi:hypothetical protein